MIKLLIGVCAIVVLAGGTVALAGQALPGGPLYGIKIGLNERVEGLFAGQGKARALWQLELANRRVIEAAQAALKGRFDAEAQTMVLTNFNEQMKGIEVYITTLTSEGKTDEVKVLATEVGRRLANSMESLAAIQKQTNESTDPAKQNSLDFLILRVGNTLAAAANIAVSTRIEDEAPVDTLDPSKTDEWGNPI